MNKITKSDCFAYHNGGCAVLYSKDCTGCKFYKTEKQYCDDFMKAQKALNEHCGFKASEMNYENLLLYISTNKG